MREFLKALVFESDIVTDRKLSAHAVLSFKKFPREGFDLFYKPLLESKNGL